MKHVLVAETYKKEDVILDGNRFLLANGHIGYRGTLEEYGKEELVGLSIAGVYDQYQDQWRENLSLPNPFYFRVSYEGEEQSVRKQTPLSHRVELDFDQAVYSRRSEFVGLVLESTRFLSHDDDALLCSRIIVKAKQEGTFSFRYGIQQDIYEIHGPHFKETKTEEKGGVSHFFGLTNEGKRMHVLAQFLGFDGEFDAAAGLYSMEKKLHEGETVVLTIIARVDEEEALPLPNASFAELLEASVNAFTKKRKACEVIIEGDEELDYEIAYSIYHALILGDEKRIRSIAARGLSGQTYKGAIFWDTEIFLLPFFALANPKIARNLLLYRIQTLPGAKQKAKSLGYEGAYYAWESQDSGLEACRADNVTDPVTGEAVITYFGTKQIHISADIVYAIDRYIEATGDKTILEEGADEVILEVARFFLSYSSLDEKGVRHIKDVIGPDEYHERVDDEAFTLLMAKRVMEILGKYVCPECLNEEQAKIYGECMKAKWASPKEKDGVIEEFDGYFALEDIDVASIKKRVKNPQEYWGGKNGIATKTQVIKQADVVALLALCPEDYGQEAAKANYEYYFPRTEHGSSLSASMHVFLGVRLGKRKEAYGFLRSSSSIDLRGAEKLFAGGVYIGGTHPAANAGAYLGLIYGFLGFREKNGKPTLDIHLPEHINKVTFHYRKEETIYEVTAHQDGRYEIKEAKR